MRVGWIGLGTMGTPMARNLCQRYSVTVWNRSNTKYGPLSQAGASISQTPSQVADKSDIVFIMLFDGPAVQSMIDSDPKFLKAMRGKILVNTSSVSVEFSHTLALQVEAAGASFLEMPVSGSKVPAEQGKLVGMMAGDSSIAEVVKPIVEPMTATAVYCGPIGTGLKAKYSINLFLVSVTAGLAESMNLARAQGVDLEAFGQILNNCALASLYSKTKVPKMLQEDWSPQASILDCYNSTELIKLAADEARVDTPLIGLCNGLFQRAVESGLSKEDMIAVYKLHVNNVSKLR